MKAWMFLLIICTVFVGQLILGVIGLTNVTVSIVAYVVVLPAVVIQSWAGFRLGRLHRG